jgi:hypothetical protein
MSIAMRMKKNREVASGITPSQAESVPAMDGKSPGGFN